MNAGMRQGLAFGPNPPANFAGVESGCGLHRLKFFLRLGFLCLFLVLILPGASWAYQIRPGDTLWSISRRYEIPLARLEEVNGLSDRSVLEIGREITIPRGAKSRRAAVHGTGPAARSLAPTGGDPGYVVAQEVSRGGGESERVAAYALRFQGVPYVWGGNDPSGFDCSGFVQYVYRASGVNLPRTTWEQYRVGVPVNGDQLRPGDPVFFSTTGPITHDGIYVGDGRFISSTGSRGVAVKSLDDPYWGPRYAGARRL